LHANGLTETTHCSTLSKNYLAAKS